jgi:hypothetical protein
MPGQDLGLANGFRSISDGQGLRTPSESASEEDYDAQQQQQQPIPVLLRRRKPGDGYDSSAMPTPEIVSLESATGMSENSSFEQLQPLTKIDTKEKRKKTYVVASDDQEIRDILRRGLERVRTMLSYRLVTVYFEVHRFEANKWHRSKKKQILDAGKSSVTWCLPGSSLRLTGRIKLLRTVHSTDFMFSSGYQ